MLLGTSWSWFALDIAFCGLGLNSSIILGSIGFGAPSATAAAEMGRSHAVWLSLRNISVGNLIISTAGLIPGFYATMAFIDFVCALCLLFLSQIDSHSGHAFLSRSGAASQSNTWDSLF